MVFSTFSVGNIIPLVAVFRELLEPVYRFGHAYNWVVLYSKVFFIKHNKFITFAWNLLKIPFLKHLPLKMTKEKHGDFMEKKNVTAT